MKEFLQEIWQNHHDPAHATYGVVGVNTWSLPGDEGRAQNLNFAISIVDILRSLNSEIPVEAENTNSCGNIVEKESIFKFW